MSQGRFLEDLTVGLTERASRTVTQADVEAFAAVSGDHNPVHLDEAYARRTPFRGRIAHGMLTAAFVSALLGERLPGPGAIYVSQSVRFLRPVKPGDTVETIAEVTAVDEKTGHVALSTWCEVEGRRVLEGEAVLIAPRKRRYRAARAEAEG